MHELLQPLSMEPAEDRGGNQNHHGGVKFLGRRPGKKPKLAFPCRFPGKLGEKDFSQGDW